MDGGIMVAVSIAVMKPLLGKLATLMGDEFAKLKNFQKEVKLIIDELTNMKDALEDLSHLDKLDRQTTTWRDMVREISYDTEDIIDDFMQNFGQSNKTNGFIRNFVDRLKTLRARHKIAGKIRKIKALALEASARRQRYTPVYKLDTPPSGNVAIHSRVAALYENAAKLVGVDTPTNELLKLLAEEDKHLKMVSILGFGGLGKTTLANVVFGRLKKKFKLSAFVPVSLKPQIPKLLHSLLYQLEDTCPHDLELNVLIEKLRELLLNNRYLIVIDDIWDVQAWDVIKCAFPQNDLGSRVIVTTRIEPVARACCSTKYDHIFNMMPLTNIDSRRLFIDRIFGSEKACPRHLSHVSDEILKKCGGLPLAVISISSMLASECTTQKERWEYVRDSFGSGKDFSCERMMEILNLSYKHLPSYLKTCLLYLGMYPEDDKIKRCNLERQWIGEGFISKENGQDVEKVARNYFNDLVNRSLIQPVYSHKHQSVTECRVHDTMLHFILLKCAEENFLTIVDSPQQFTGLQYDVRRLSIRMDGVTSGETILPRHLSMSQVRSVMFFGSSKNTPPLSMFKFLRVVHIDLYDAKIDLTGLCKLYQLRYLWINPNCSWTLPKHIRVLRHLETLDLAKCSSIPSDMVYLPRLTHLDVDTSLPDGIGNLKSLQHMCAFIIEANMLENIKGLGELTNLRILILKSNHELDNLDHLCSSLAKLCSLEDLTVDLRGCVDSLVSFSCPSTPYRLESLNLLWTCWFSRVPTWMGKLGNLDKLECKVDELLNDGVGVLAGLPTLTTLRLKIRRRSIKEVITIYGKGAFPCLKNFELTLSCASYLSFQPGSMPMLQTLKVLFNVYKSNQNGSAPSGIEHLLALEELYATIGCVDMAESERPSAESALRSAITVHPKHPHVGIESSCGRILFF